MLAIGGLSAGASSGSCTRGRRATNGPASVQVFRAGDWVRQRCSARRVCRCDARGALRLADCGRFPDGVELPRQVVRRASAAAGRIRACPWEGRRSPKPSHGVRILALVPCRRPAALEILESGAGHPKISGCRPFPLVRAEAAVRTMSRRRPVAGPENRRCYAKRAALLRG